MVERPQTSEKVLGMIVDRVRIEDKILTELHTLKNYGRYCHCGSEANKLWFITKGNSYTLCAACGGKIENA